MRETIVLILCAILLAVAAFEGGYIWRDREADELRKQVYQLDLKTKDMNGRLVGVETTEGRRQKAPAAGAVGRKQGAEGSK